MMDYKILYAVVITIAAFAGWGNFIYNLFTRAPKIKGQIFNVMLSQIRLSNIPNQTFTAFNVYLYLTNGRKNNVHILDYELEVDTGAGYERAKRIYGVQNVKEWKFESSTQIIEMPDFPQKLIYAKAEPVKYGIPLHGWVLFASEKPKSQFKDKVKRYRITCIDAFQKRHQIISSPGKFPSLYLLQDIAGIEITDRKSRKIEASGSQRP